MRIVLAANPEADQPWVADAAAELFDRAGLASAVDTAVSHVRPQEVAAA